MSLKVVNESWNINFSEPILLSTITDNVVAKTISVSNVDELCHKITTNTWSPSLYTGNRRVIANFVSTKLLALDIDGGCTIAEAQSRLFGFRYVIAPTRSHLKEKNGIVCERYRVILFLSELITDQTTYAATWNSAFQLLPKIDVACKDVARQYFSSLYIHTVQDGELFPVSKGLPPKAPTRALPPGKYPIPPFVDNFMKNGSDNWNHNLFKVAKMLQESGYELEETLDLLSTMSNSQFSGELDRADIKTIKSAFSKVGKFDPQIPWPCTITTRGGAEVVDPVNQNNFLYLIEDVLKLDIKYNELRNCIEIDNRQWSDMDLSSLRMKCRDFYLKPSQEILDDVINAIAQKNSYHPLKDVIESTPWDGHDYIGDLFSTISIDGDTLPIYKTYLERWLIGMMAKIYTPGSQNNVLVFVGSQGIGKSLWLEKFGIVPNIMNEGPLDPTNKDDKLKTTNTLIWSISELDGVTRKKDVSAIKSFLTDGTFDIRAPYDRYSKQLKSVCSFAASVNENNFLVDTTGNRRFLVIPVKRLNKTHTVNMQQVFAQAYSLYRAGNRWWFEEEEIVQVNKENENYISNNRMDYLCTKIVAGTDQINADELLTVIGYKDARTPYDYGMLGRSLKAINIESKRVVVNGQKITVYYINKIETEKRCMS